MIKLQKNETEFFTTSGHEMNLKEERTSNIEDYEAIRAV